MLHQDWKVQYVKTTNNKNESKKNTPTISLETKLEKNVEDGNMRTKNIDKHKSINFQKKRMAKGFTQKQVANKLNVPIKIINDIESGKSKNNSQIINKLNKLYM